MSDKPNWPTNGRSAGYFHETCFSLAQTERLTTFLLASMTLFYPSLHPMIIESLKPPPAYFPCLVSFISSFFLVPFSFLKIFNFLSYFLFVFKVFRSTGLTIVFTCLSPMSTFLGSTLRFVFCCFFFFPRPRLCA